VQKISSLNIDKALADDVGNVMVAFTAVFEGGETLVDTVTVAGSPGQDLMRKRVKTAIRERLTHRAYSYLEGPVDVSGGAL
jgi:hypothetical protein